MTNPKRQRPRRKPAWLDEQLIERDEIAELFNVRPDTVTRWARTGRLHGLRTPGGRWRYRQADVEALLAEGLDEEDVSTYVEPASIAADRLVVEAVQ